MQHNVKQKMQTEKYFNKLTVICTINKLEWALSPHLINGIYSLRINKTYMTMPIRYMEFFGTKLKPLVEEAIEALES